MPASPLAEIRSVREALHMNAEQLNQKLRWLVLERQALRELGAATDELERNRLEIVRVQWKLSYVFIENHRPHGLPEAA
jgi:GAF domain-containing protein